MDVRAAIAWLGILTLLGCANAHAPVDPAQRALFDQVMDASCARSLACARDAWVSGTLCDARGDYARDLELGRLHVDAVLAHRCVEAMQALGPCVARQPNVGWLWDDFPPPMEAWDARAADALCEAALLTTGESGAPPYRAPCGDTLCASGAICVTDASCTRRCVTLASAGEPCGIGCLGTLRCDGGVCVPRLTDADCIASGMGHLAARDGTCLPDVAALGAACDPDRDFCIAGAVCAPTERRCVALPSPGEPCIDGTTCDHEEDCTSGVCTTAAPPRCDCDAGRYCGASGTCSSDAQGASCRVHWVGAMWVDACPSGFSCAHGQCRRTAAIGEPCDEASLCVEGATCAAGRCTRVAGPGECPARPCPFDYACRDGTCRLDVPLLGDPCDVHACNNLTVCVDGICARPPPLALGAPCDYDDQCAADAECGADRVCARFAPVARGGTCRHFFDAFAASGSDCAPGLTCRLVEGGGERCCP